MQEKFDAGAREPLVREGSLPAAAPVVQRYRIEREPTTREVYSVSDDKGLVTGMATPNHALFVANATKFDRMNSAIAASPLEVFHAGPEKLFGEDYLRVGLRFKTDSPDREVPSLQESYTGSVAPKIQSFRQDLSGKKREEIAKAVADSKGEINPGAINKPLATAVRKLELFKKLILAELSRSGDQDAKNGPIDNAHQIVSSLETALYSSEMRQGEMSTAMKALEAVGVAQLPRTQIIAETLAELWEAMRSLENALPAGKAVDLLSFHNLNFQAAQLEAVAGPDNVLLYRACDVTASTLLGNKITPENADRLKTYSRGRAFHYATKIVESGKDWVTLEGFAAGDVEQKIIGIDRDSAAKNVDNTWQYIMYGSLAAKEPGALSDEDRHFELYTKLRYYLKGIKEAGTFDLSRRQKLVNNQLTNASFKLIFPASATQLEEADALFKSLVTGGVLNQEGRVASAEKLGESEVKAALLPKHQAKAKTVFGILRDSIPSRHIQMGVSSDLANIQAWLAYLGESSMDLDQLEDALVQAIAVEKLDPRALSQDLWEKLPLALRELKKRPPPAPAPPAPAPSAPAPSAPSPSAPSPSSAPPPAPEVAEKSVAPVAPAPAPAVSATPAWAPSKDVSTRTGLVAEAKAELQRLRDLWRGSDAKRAHSYPPDYSGFVVAIDFLRHVSPDTPLEELESRVAGWLAAARSSWL